MGSDQIRARGVEFEIAWQRNKLLGKEIKNYSEKAFPKHLAIYLPSKQDVFTVLDVGCGPISTIGVSYPGKTINMVGIDPLADRYKILLNELGIKLPYKLVDGKGEDILDNFEKNSFDLVYSNNALDHAQSPYAIIQAMIEVCKPDSKVVFSVNHNEAPNNNYVGFHQWNFTSIEQTLLFWNHYNAHVLDECIGGLPYRLYEHVMTGKKYPQVILCVINKVDQNLSCMTEIQNGLYAKYNDSFNSLSFIKSINFNSSERFFVHLYKKSKFVEKFSFTWNLQQSMKSLVFPQLNFDSIKVGQYAYTFENEQSTHVRLWESTLRI